MRFRVDLTKYLIVKPVSPVVSYDLEFYMASIEAEFPEHRVTHVP